MMHANAKLIALAAAALLIAGCGLKGPLRLPQEQGSVAPGAEAEQTPVKRRTNPRPAPQSQKKDAEEAPPVSPPDPDRPANPEPVSPPPGR
jgi:predicted small lipoprotein YifL